MAYFLNDQERQQFEANEPPELKRADVWMISGCEDRQTSADVSNVHSFQLPDSQGLAGGACTAALLSVLYEDEQSPLDEYSFTEVMERMRVNLRQKGFKQIPQLSSSRPINMADKFKIVPDDLPGTRRAVLIGINYVGAKTGELRGCHNDVFQMVRTLGCLLALLLLWWSFLRCKSLHCPNFCC
jgi:metacaspase-1